MSITYREHLDAFSRDLTLMCETVTTTLRAACYGLTHTSLRSAQEAMTLTDELLEIRERCTIRATQLLALEASKARDVRQVLASIYIIEDFHRMGVLAMHIASVARRTYPEPVVAPELMVQLRTLARLTVEMSEKVHGIVADPDPEAAVDLAVDDDAVDSIYDEIMHALRQDDWRYSPQMAVDMASLVRFFERYADHTVNVAQQILFLVTGMKSADYQARRALGDKPEEIEQASEDTKAATGFQWPRVVRLPFKGEN